MYVIPKSIQGQCSPKCTFTYSSCGYREQENCQFFSFRSDVKIDSIIFRGGYGSFSDGRGSGGAIVAVPPPSDPGVNNPITINMTNLEFYDNTVRNGNFGGAVDLWLSYATLENCYFLQ
eukprot:UN34302